jgi:G3E family GTPase
LVSPEGCEGVLEELEKEIHNINSLVSIIRSVRCQVDLPKLLNCRAYDATVSYMYLCFSSASLSS